MVLSNKKLKQKLREALVESIAAKESTKPESKPPQQPTSLKELLGSATQKPRLSKREKRRRADALPSQRPRTSIRAESENAQNVTKQNASGEVLDGEIEGKKKKKKKKRKRESFGGEVKENEVSDSKEGKLEVKSEKAKKKKRKQKNKKKKSEETKEIEPEFEEAQEEVMEPIESQGNDEVANKVYVGGIPYYSTEDDIRSFFEGCGTITEVDCVTFPESGKFRGIAMLTFKTEAAAKRALALDGADMGGFFLKIQPYKAMRTQTPTTDFSPQIVDGYNRVYIGNLSWDITEDDVRNLFSDCKITSIRFGEDKDTGEFRGYAHVDFSDTVSLSIALKLDQKVVCERPVRIRCAVPKKQPTNHMSSITANKDPENDKPASSAVKKKRRTCYNCGTPGHLSSACPTKQAIDSANSDAN
ncbi:hypothetical protein Syun_015947 [Stephania yunnanensis]|uniref:Uncharacterized protein n=1 Tax=Stephania yunnanensis TaxID=152371 RepID=A0AAP0P3E8_9MAGN